MTAQAMMREVLRMVGNPAGNIVSKEFLLLCINEEAQRVAARFPHIKRVTYTPSSSKQLHAFADIWTQTSYGLSIKKVMVDGDEAELISSDEIERLVTE